MSNSCLFCPCCRAQRRADRPRGDGDELRRVIVLTDGTTSTVLNFAAYRQRLRPGHEDLPPQPA